jgi:hypothetical protein
MTEIIVARCDALGLLGRASPLYSTGRLPALYAGNLTPALTLSQPPRVTANSNACHRGKHRHG